jgi:branched-chain amino acid transport system substrate-binding protein
MSANLSRPRFLAGAFGTTVLAACSATSSGGGGSAASAVRFGVSGPFSGDDANYGRVWRNAMDLAADDLNRDGGLRGRPLELVYQDTQSDPRQSVAVAQQFADDPSILVELGDFSSAASIAASPVYERAGLVQFGFTNSDPKFTAGGDYMFSTATSVRADARIIAKRAARIGRRHAVVFQDTVWGKSASSAYADSAKQLGVDVVSVQSYLPDTKDFHAVLGNVHAASPDVVVYYSYYTDGALLARQARDVGLTARPVTTGACYNQQFITLGGRAVEGIVLPVEFFAADPRPAVRRFARAYEARYHDVPDLFAGFAFDAVRIAAWAAIRGGFTRSGVRDAFATGSGIPSIVDGPFHFGADRRSARSSERWLVVRNGAFTLWNDA